jgi:abortive infection AbiH-like protein
MNRLILIGNGFDLAHGMKTRYKDFLLDYLVTSINSFYDQNSFSDSLFSMRFRDINRGHWQKPIDYATVDNVLERFNQIKVDYNSRIIIDITSNFLFESLEKIEKLNWVDLEMEFFDNLIKAKESTTVGVREEAVELVNAELEFIKTKLIEYLKKQQADLENIEINSGLLNCFTESIKPVELVTVRLRKQVIPESMVLLNFNYTNILESYVSECSNIIPSEINYIHGDLFENHAEPIFGFGDELDKRYIQFEDENKNYLFRHIKSFEYFKSKNYYNLIRFLDSDDFQVQIFGHSCGLSDRTMLNQIFEHENCVSIKLFYHENINDFTNKTYEIYRHFKDKGLLRKKMVPFELSIPMPQPVEK